MNVLKNIIKYINTTNEWVGRFDAWLVTALTFVVCFEVISRYVFNHPTIWSYTMGWMLSGAFFLLGGAYTLLYDRHVRIDVIYLSLQAKIQSWMNVIFYLLFLPIIGVTVWAGFRFAISSLRIHETDQLTMWHVPLWIPKMLIPIGLTLLWFQCLSELLRNIMKMRGVKA